MKKHKRARDQSQALQGCDRYGVLRQHCIPLLPGRTVSTAASCVAPPSSLQSSYLTDEDNHLSYQRQYHYISFDMITQPRESLPPDSAAPVPTQIHHPSHLPSLPLHKPQLLNSIASGAHYGGQLPAHSNSQRPGTSHKRTHSKNRSVESNDPFMENEFKDVMDDLQEVSHCSNIHHLCV